MNNLLQIFSTGDLPLYFLKQIQELSIYPYIWSSINGNGFGQNVSFILGFKLFFAFLSKFLLEILNLRWEIAEKVFFIPVFFTLSFLAAYLFSKLFFEDRILRVISGIIYATNTYALMLVSGGQFGVYFAYAFSPIVLWSFFKEKVNPITSGLIFGFLLLLDPRIAGIVLISIFLFSIFQKRSIRPILTSFLIGILLNFNCSSFIGYNSLNSIYTNKTIKWKIYCCDIIYLKHYI